MIFLSLDISTSCIGMALMRNDKLIKDGLINFKKKPYKDLDFYEKLNVFEEKIQEFVGSIVFDEIVVEESLAGHNHSTNKILIKLGRFNGACRYIIHKLYNRKAKEIHPQTVKKQIGLKVPRGGNKKKLTIEFISQLYPEFSYELTRAGNPVPGTDDRADAISIGLAYYIKYHKD